MVKRASVPKKSAPKQNTVNVEVKKLLANVTRAKILASKNPTLATKMLSLAARQNTPGFERLHSARRLRRYVGLANK